MLPIEENNERLRLASIATTDEELLELLRTHTPNIERAIISNQNSSNEVLETIWRENLESDLLSYGVVCSLISHNNFNSSLLDERINKVLLEDDTRARSNIFLATSLWGKVNESIIAEVFKRREEFDLMAAYFLSNPNTPFELVFKQALKGYGLAQTHILNLNEEDLQAGMKLVGYELAGAPKEWIAKIFGWERSEWNH